MCAELKEGEAFDVKNQAFYQHEFLFCVPPASNPKPTLSLASLPHIGWRGPPITDEIEGCLGKVPSHAGDGEFHPTGDLHGRAKNGRTHEKTVGTSGRCHSNSRSFVTFD